MIPGLAIDRQEHERMLNRERQRRYQARKRNAANGRITDDNGQPNSTLDRIARNLANGMTNNQALVQAGSSNHAIELIGKARKGLADVLKVKGVTLDKVAENVVRRLDATSPMFTQEGCIERPDWQAQASATRDSIALLDRAGELPAASQSHGGTQITVNIVRFNSTPQDVVNNAIEAKSFTSETDVSNEKD